MAHAQSGSRIRLEWGPTGGSAISAGADIAVVVDVLSFTTTLSVAVSRGTTVFPFGWKDDRARAYAHDRGAVLAVGRLEATELDDPPPSLSPAQLLTGRYVDRLVLPSPNGSTICSALRSTRESLIVVGGSLRNRAAVAAWLAPQLADGATVAIVAAGERWLDGSLRPAVEDLWGAGAVIEALSPSISLVDTASVEARHAAMAYSAIADRVGDELLDCASGRELVDIGFGADVEAAAALDVDACVPVLTSDGFVAAPPVVGQVVAPMAAEQP